MKSKKRITALTVSWIASILSAVLVPTLSTAVVAVGEAYEGGTVFCVSQTPDLTECVPQGSGNYGLIMAQEDQANSGSNPEHGITWATTYQITGALSDDEGAANTAVILAALPQDHPRNNAAWLCHNYRDPAGYSDWYLPAKNELNKLYLFARAHNLIGPNCIGARPGGVQCLVGGGELDQFKAYWSSTERAREGDSHNAYAQNFDNGSQFEYYKVRLNFGVRAVRAFGTSVNQPGNSSLPQSPQEVGLTVPLAPSLATSRAAAAAAAAVQHRHYIALVDSESVEPGHLSFRRGELITIIDARNAEWWVGELNGRRGLVPANYL